MTTKTAWVSAQAARRIITSNPQGWGCIGERGHMRKIARRSVIDAANKRMGIHRSWVTIERRTDPKGTAS